MLDGPATGPANSRRAAAPPTRCRQRCDIRRLGRLFRVPRRSTPRVAGFAARPGHAGRDRCHGARRFQRRTVRSQGGEIGVPPTGRQVHRPHRRTGRAARRFRSPPYLRHLPSAAVLDRASGRTPAGACPSPGTPGRPSQAGNAGSTCIRSNGSITATSCTGPGDNRTGTSCARIAIRRTCRRTTTRPPIPMRRAGARSASAARLATARDRSTHVSPPSAAAPKD